jgi:putative salt-induced outer membrane protein YdiY
MKIARSSLAAVAFVTLAASLAFSQPPEPPPLWDVQVGGSFVGTTGNTDVSTLGADFSANSRGPIWRLESTATAVRSSDRGIRRSERYLAGVRAKRRLTRIVSASFGERLERDQLAGMDLRSILDAGFEYALVRQTMWTLDALTSLAWKHEEPTDLTDLDHPVGVLQAVNRFLFGASGDLSQRFTFYPDFKDSSDYRSEVEITAQAALNRRLALKLGYLWRYANSPVVGFEKVDNTTTASVVLTWRASTPAPTPERRGGGVILGVPATRTFTVR